MPWTHSSVGWILNKKKQKKNHCDRRRRRQRQWQRRRCCKTKPEDTTIMSETEREEWMRQTETIRSITFTPKSISMKYSSISFKVCLCLRYDGINIPCLLACSYIAFSEPIPCECGFGYELVVVKYERIHRAEIAGNTRKRGYVAIKRRGYEWSTFRLRGVIAIIRIRKMLFSWSGLIWRCAHMHRRTCGIRAFETISYSVFHLVFIRSDRCHIVDPGWTRIIPISSS